MSVVRLLETLRSTRPDGEYSHVRFYWDEIYEPYYVPLVDELLNDVPPGHLLDCGAGYGLWSAHFSSKGWDVTAIDTSRDRLGVLSDWSGADEAAISVREADLLKIPFEDRTFDVSFSIATIHVLKDPKRAAREMARVTRSGGSLLICYANPEHPVNALSWKGARNVRRVDRQVLNSALKDTADLVRVSESRANDARLIPACGDIPLYFAELYRTR